MSMWQDLSAVENDDVTFSLKLTYNGAPFDATAYTLSLVLKASAAAADSSGVTFTAGSGLTVTNAALGQVTWKLPHASTATPGKQWWHISAVDGSGNRTTLMFGNLTIMAV